MWHTCQPSFVRAAYFSFKVTLRSHPTSCCYCRNSPATQNASPLWIANSGQISRSVISGSKGRCKPKTPSVGRQPPLGHRTGPRMELPPRSPHPASSSVAAPWGWQGGLPWCCSGKTGRSHCCPVGLLQGPGVLIHAKHLEDCLAHAWHAVSVSFWFFFSFC